MKYLTFTIQQIPDLSLAKYSSLDESGVDGIIEKQKSFLRQLNRKGILSDVSFHLLYEYNPSNPSGEKLSISLIAAGEDNSLKYTRELIQNSSISPYYNIISNESVSVLSVTQGTNDYHFTVRNHLGLINEYKVAPNAICKGSLFSVKDINYHELFQLLSSQNDKIKIKITNNTIIEIDCDSNISPDGLQICDNKYECISALGKREYFVRPSINLPDDGDLKYYKISEWEMNEDARLFNALKLMEGFNQSVAYRVDIFPVDYTAQLREVLPLKWLTQRTSLKATKHISDVSITKDDNASEVLKHYNKLLESFQGSPHFMVNIIAFANDPIVSSSVVDAAGAEAVAEGTYSVTTQTSEEYGQNFTAKSFIQKIRDISDPETHRSMRFFPSLFLLEEITPFFMFPALYDGETVEIKKETAPIYNPEGLHLAVDENNYDVNFPVELFKKHAFLAGVPGSGKTNSMLHIVSTLWKKYKIPFLVLEPAKREYRALAMTRGMEDMIIFSPSSGTNFPLHINPFEFPLGMSLSEHIRNLFDVFDGAFTLEGPTPFLLDYSIENVYRKKKWYPHTINDGSLEYPTMQELYDTLEEEINSRDYDSEIKGNLKSVLQVRIGSLIRREMGDVFNVPMSTLKPEEWLDNPVLIELEAMGNGPANFLSLLLSTLIRETLKISPNADGKALRHVIFYEEAHNLIGPISQKQPGVEADAKLSATAFIVKMLAEVRALREGIVIADQLPTAMAPEVLKNTGLKIAHRITAEDDRQLIGGTMSADSVQLEQMATYLPGEALISYEGLQKPFKSKICQWENGTASYDTPTDIEVIAKIYNTACYEKTAAKSCFTICEKCKSNTKLKQYYVTFENYYNQHLADIVACNGNHYEQLTELFIKFAEETEKSMIDIYSKAVHSPFYDFYTNWARNNLWRLYDNAFNILNTIHNSPNSTLLRQKKSQQLQRVLSFCDTFDENMDKLHTQSQKHNKAWMEEIKLYRG